ncbi:hypothetical protein GCM10028820_12520 [Tessaracoccus terricola]
MLPAHGRQTSQTATACSAAPTASSTAAGNQRIERPPMSMPTAYVRFWGRAPVSSGTHEKGSTDAAARPRHQAGSTRR